MWAAMESQALGELLTPGEAAHGYEAATAFGDGVPLTSNRRGLWNPPLFSSSYSSELERGRCVLCVLFSCFLGTFDEALRISDTLLYRRDTQSSKLQPSH